MTSSLPGDEPADRQGESSPQHDRALWVALVVLVLAGFVFVLAMTLAGVTPSKGLIWLLLAWVVSIFVIIVVLERRARARPILDREGEKGER